MIDSIFNIIDRLSHKPSTELKGFLEAKDWDESVLKNRKIHIIRNEDESYIRFVIENWDTPQAIANLLFHPIMIPPDIRFETLMKGMESDNIYFHLAAIVGAQRHHSLWFSEFERFRIKQKLHHFLCQTKGIRALRASLSYYNYASIMDTDSLIQAAEFHLNDKMRKNILAILIKIHGLDNIRAILMIAQGEGNNGAFILRAMLIIHAQKVKNAPERKRAFLSSSIATPTLAYIPNWEEVLERRIVC